MKLIDMDKLRRKVGEYDMQELYLPVHFLDLADSLPNEYPDILGKYAANYYRIFDRAHKAYCTAYRHDGDTCEECPYYDSGKENECFNKFVDDMLNACKED